MNITLKQILLSWDFGLSVVVTVALAFFLGDTVPVEFAKDIYGVGISVLSIIFSVYFAALALIMTSGDDDFVHFLEENGDFTAIVSTFRFSLLLLFGALVYSIVVYIYTSIEIYSKSGTTSTQVQSEFFLWFFIFFFSYSLLAALTATLDSITYSVFRTKFLRATRKNYKDKE